MVSWLLFAHPPQDPPRKIPKTRRLALLGTMIALDEAMGIFGPLQAAISWFTLPGVYLMCGWRLTIVYLLIGSISAIPSLVNSGAGAAQTAPIVASSIRKPPFIPYLTPAIAYLDSSIHAFFLPVTNFWLFLPLWMRSLDLLMFFGWWVYASREFYLGGARHILRQIPQMVDWGIVDPKPDFIFGPQASDSYQGARRLRRRMLGRVFN